MSIRFFVFHCQYNALQPHALQLWQEAISKFTPTMFQNSINNVEKIIKKDWTHYMGPTCIEDISPIIIQLGKSDTKSSQCIFVLESDNNIFDIPI